MKKLLILSLATFCFSLFSSSMAYGQFKGLKSKLSTKKSDLQVTNREDALRLINDEAYEAFKSAKRKFKSLEKALKDGYAKRASQNIGHIRRYLDIVKEKAPKFSIKPEEERLKANVKVYEETYGKIEEAVEEIKPEKAQKS